MNLNIGSSCARGIYKTAEWVNMDIVRSKGVNVAGDMLMMPFEDNSFKRIHCIHVLEHLTRDKHLPALEEMVRVLEPGACCYVEVPDFVSIVTRLNAAFRDGDRRAIHIWRTSVFGKTERAGMAHHFGFDRETLDDLMLRAGFSKVVRSVDMISDHHSKEPVILMRGEK